MRIVQRLIHCYKCKKPLAAFVPEDTYDYVCEGCENETKSASAASSTR